MPTYRVTLSDGRIVTLESDAEPNEADVLMAIGAQSSVKEPTIGANRHQEAKIGAAFPTTALPADTAIGESNETRAFANKPLANVTGNETVDSLLTSPTALIGIAGPAARGAAKLAGKIPTPSSDSLRKVATGIENGPVRTAAGWMTRKAADWLEKRAGTPSAPPSPAVSVPAVAEAVAPKAPYELAIEQVKSLPPHPYAMQPAAAEAVAPAMFNPNTARRSVVEAAAAMGEKIAPYETSNATALMSRGKSANEAVQIVIKNRPASTLTPAEEFAKRFGTPSDDAVRAHFDLRNARGELKTPSAQTAAERYPR